MALFLLHVKAKPLGMICRLRGRDSVDIERFVGEDLDIRCRGGLEEDSVYCLSGRASTNDDDLDCLPPHDKVAPRSEAVLLRYKDGWMGT
jgi:hypothetical protein